MEKLKALKDNHFIDIKLYYYLKPTKDNNAQNSITFSNYIRRVFIEDGELIVLFDVTSLYTNITIIYYNLCVKCDQGLC